MNTEFVDVLPNLLKIGYNKHESIEVAKSVLQISTWQKDPANKRIYNLSNGTNIVCKAAYNSNNYLHKLLIQKNLFSAVLDAANSDAELVETKVARTVLFANRELKATYTIPNWLQIRPTAAALHDFTRHQQLSESRMTLDIPFPFSLEVEYKSSTLYELESHRLIVAIDKAKWLLATFMDIAIFSQNQRYSWAYIDDKYCLVNCGIGDGLENDPQDSFTDISSFPKLAPREMKQYYDALGIGSREFQISDLNYLYSCFIKLNDEDKQRFLGCCANIFEACNPSLKWQQKLSLSVSAIEHLLEDGQQCDKCKSHIGITKNFKEFINKYVSPAPQVESFYNAIYNTRSKITHGVWNPEVNEPFFSLHSIDEHNGLAAWAAAKKGAIYWLLTKSGESS